MCTGFGSMELKPSRLSTAPAIRFLRGGCATVNIFARKDRAFDAAVDEGTFGDYEAFGVYGDQDDQSSEYEIFIVATGKGLRGSGLFSSPSGLVVFPMNFGPGELRVPGLG